MPLTQLVEPLLILLDQAVNLIRANSGKTNPEQISVIVDRISAIFKCYYHPEGMADLTGIGFFNMMYSQCWMLEQC